MSCPSDEIAESDTEKLVQSTIALMSGYNFMLRHTALPHSPLFPVSTTSTSDGQTGGLPRRAFHGLLACFGLVLGFDLCFLPMTLARYIRPFVTAPDRSVLDAVASVVTDYFLPVLVSVLLLNMFLVGVPAALLLEPVSATSKRESVPRFLLTWVNDFSRYFIRRQIYRRLRAFLCLYRGQIAQMRSDSPMREKLIEMTEQMGKLKDSVETGWQLLDVLRVPSILVGLFAVMGFMPSGKLPTSISVCIISAVLVPYVLARKASFLAADWPIPLQTSVLSSAVLNERCSLNRLERIIYESLQCPGRTKPVQIDLICQIFAGVLISLGITVFVSFGHPSTPTSFLFWTSVQFVYIWFFVVSPWRSLRSREHCEIKETGNTGRALTFSGLPAAIVIFLAACYVSGVAYPKLAGIVYPALQGSMAARRSAVSFVDQNVGVPLHLNVTKDFPIEEATIRPEGFNRSCSLTSGDIVTISNDEKSVEVVSAPGSTCPTHYRSPITDGILLAAGGISLPGQNSSSQQTHHNAVVPKPITSSSIRSEGRQIRIPTDSQ
jgi:hypothetical protein